MPTATCTPDGTSTDVAVPAQTLQKAPPPIQSSEERQRRPRFVGAVLGASTLAVGAAMLLWVFRPDAGAAPLLATGEAPNLPVDRLGRIELMEREDAFVVDPRVTLDPQGGFLVADSRELQVRRYNEDGKLVANFGRKGSGPGEFQHLSAVVRVNHDSLLVADMSGQLSSFDADGEFARRVDSNIAPLYDMAAWDDTLVILAGRTRGGKGLIHLWNSRTDRLVRSLLDVTPPSAEFAGAFAFAGTSDATVRGDTIAAVFALADTVFLFHPSGRTIEKIQIPFRHFRPLREPMPRSGSHLDAFRAWSETFSSISSVFWASDGSFLIEFYDMEGMEPRLSVLHMDRRGGFLSEHNGTPRLLAAARSAPLVYFAENEALVPNVWAVGRLAR
jgi:hypothetical protein